MLNLHYAYIQNVWELKKKDLRLISLKLKRNCSKIKTRGNVDI